MAIVKTDDKHYSAIAEKIRSHTGENTTYKPNEMPNGVDTVFAAGQENGYKNGYDAGETTGHASGYAEGHNEGYAEGESAGYASGKTDGFAEGEQAEYDRFWDAYQENGNRGSYLYAFAGEGWTVETLSPKYDVVPTSANSLFYSNSALGIDISEHFNSIGKKLDFSECTKFGSMLMYSAITGIGIIDTRSATTIDYIFRYAQSLKKVEKLILKDDGSQTIGTYAFDRASVLKDITIEGKIGKDINIKWSPLSKASIESCINALSESVSARTLTLSKSAVNAAFETSEGAADGSASDEWLTLIATKSNWTISLV